MLAIVMGIALTGLQADDASLQSRLEARLALQSDFSGIAVISEGEAVLASTAIGQADRGAQTPLTLDQDWLWASISKQVTAVVAVRAMEQGRLALDDPITTHWPDFPVETGAQITLTDLMRHTSGLADMDDVPPQAYLTGFDPMGVCLAEPKAQPGSGFEYNNCDTLVLAAVLERVYAKPFADILEAEIFQPAGMSETRLGAGPDRGDVLGYRASGTPAVSVDLALFGASAALVGPPDDLVRFNAALTDGRLLSEEGLEVLWQGIPRLGYVALGAWSFAAPLAGCEGSVRLIERRGALAGMHQRNIIAPDQGRSLIVFSNNGDLDYGEIWMGQGLSYNLASIAFCSEA